jgi:membrane-associated phospholipid phosphatase
MIAPTTPLKDRVLSFGLGFRLLAGSIVLMFCTLGVYQLDSFASDSEGGIDLPGDIRKAINLSEAFAHGFGAAAILASLLVVAVNHRRAVWMAVLITLTSGLAANGLKSCFVRIRPHSQGKIEVISEDPGNQERTTDKSTAEAKNLRDSSAGTSIAFVPESFWDSRQRSFPSGHAATAVGLAIGLTLAFPRGWFVFGMLASMACIQRVSSGAHYPSDVLAGASLSFFCAGMLVLASHLFQRDSETRR